VRFTGTSPADPSGDLVTLTFTDVDESAPARAFSLDLDVAQEAYAGALRDAARPDAAVPTCSPPLATLPELLGQLNADRDLGRFVRSVRSAFAAAALSNGVL